MSAWDWHDLAACRGKDVNLFFGTEAERYDQAGKEQREREAKAVCAGCPARAGCLEYAIGRPERYGIFGGLTEVERQRLRRSLSRARARERVA